MILWPVEVPGELWLTVPAILLAGVSVFICGLWNLWSLQAALEPALPSWLLDVHALLPAPAQALG